MITIISEPPVLPLLFWLHSDTLIERIEREIDAVSDDAHALSQDQRSAQISVIDRDRLAVGREEEHWLCVATKDDSMNLLRRTDADPRAVLDLRTLCLPR